MTVEPEEVAILLNAVFDIGRVPRSGTESSQTLRWRKPDSNHRSRSYDRVSTVAEGRYRTDKPDGVI